ncbi:MAG: endonuclease VII domain-containing protein [Fibromonadaceae bacterium]|jgi:hypothetical protein|nr:endonuclease VII domain-containing protein [Fibromonadaceae bacterium]
MIKEKIKEKARVSDNVFVYISKDIKVHGAKLKKYSVGIIESKGKKESKINFIWFKEPIAVPNSDYKIFDPLETGDLFLKKVCNVCQRLLNTKTFSEGLSCKDCEKIIDGVSAISKKRKVKKKNKSESKIFSCPVCDKTTIPKLTNKIALDHSHKDLHVRGWVCDSCNAGIGKFKNDIILFENAIKFLS